MTLRLLFILLLPLSMCLTAADAAAASISARRSYAQPLSVTLKDGHRTNSRHYTADNPLIYEDSWERWPYAFLSHDGIPRGFNVELMTKMMRRLRIPYEIRMRSLERTREDLRNNKCDVCLGVVSDYNASYGKLGKVTICYLQSYMLVPKEDSVASISIASLRGRRLTVREGSRSRQYLLSQGFPDSLFNIVPNMEMESEILREATSGAPNVIWDVMRMKRIIRKYNLGDRYVAVPLDIPKWEYRFMSGDTALLARLDSLCSIMKERGEIDKMQAKWRHTDQYSAFEDGYTDILLAMLALTVTAIIVFCFVRHLRRIYSRNTLADIRTQMRLALHSNKIKVWCYFLELRNYAWMTSDGEVKKYYTSYEFSKFYPDGNFNLIHTVVTDFLVGRHEPYTDAIRCYSITEPQKVLDVEVTIRQLHDEYGKVYMICGLQCDITDSKAAQASMRLLGERYRTAFLMARGTVIRFDAGGRIVAFNEVGLQRMGIDRPEEFYAEGYTLHDVDLLEGIDVDTCPDDLHYSRIVRREDMLNIRYANSKNFNPKPYAMPGYTGPEYMCRTDKEITSVGYYDLHFVKTMGESGQPVSYMLFINDRTAEIKAMKMAKEKRRQQAAMEKERLLLQRRRNYILQVTEIWMVCYQPSSKELTIYDSGSQERPPYSQISLLEFIDADDIMKVFKVFMKLDSHYRGDVTLDVKTQLRNDAGEIRFFHVDMRPEYGPDGSVEQYYGTCRDVTEFVTARSKLLEETRIVREGELVKSNFLKNMSYSLRQPLISISRSISRLGANGLTDGQQEDLVGSITGNIRRLITLSDDTLLLSRIEAGLLTFRNEPVDFVPLFRKTVDDTLGQYHSSTVTHKVESTYENLWLSFDATFLARILHEAVALSARYTTIGTITVRYMYIRGKLSIVVQDTGQGIPPSVFSHIFEAHVGEEYTMQERAMHLSGLEMPICKALVELQGGTIEIDTDPGRGTSIYITMGIDQVEGNGTTETAEAAALPPATPAAETT